MNKKGLDSKDVDVNERPLMQKQKHLENMKQEEEQVGGINGSIKCFQSSWLRRDGEKNVFKKLYS